jgi:hypothetical protein
VKPSNATFRLPTNASRCHTNGLETSLVRQNSLKVSQTQEKLTAVGSEREEAVSCCSERLWIARRLLCPRTSGCFDTVAYTGEVISMEEGFGRFPCRLAKNGGGQACLSRAAADAEPPGEKC